MVNKQATKPQKILILVASPVDQAKLRLNEEAREIDEGLRRSQHRHQFQLEKQGALRIDGLRRALLDTKPQILHFCGHGTGSDGLVLENEQGNTQLVATEALADLFSLFAGQIECVVLNACYSEVQASAIVQHVGYVIGMNKTIGDKAAIKFSIGFYDALGGGRSVEDAYKFGCNAIQSEGIREHLTPVLKVNTAWKYVLEKSKQPPNSTKGDSSISAEPLDRLSPIQSLNGLPPQQLGKLPEKEVKEKSVGKQTLEDHKYDGRLVTIEIKLYQIVNDENNILVNSTISFGMPEIKIPQKNLFRSSTTDIKFGIKRGELGIKIKNGFMLLDQRKEFLIEIDKNSWKAEPIGKKEYPIWEFMTKKNNEREAEISNQVLHGLHKNQYLGILELLDKNKCCELNACFKISINRMYIEIIDFDDGTNKKQKETKIGLLLKYLKPELENYVSKVVIRYEPASIL